MSTKPSFEITLPSRGRLYDGAIPDGTIKISPMTAKEEKLLAGARGNGGGVLDSVLNACLPDLPFPAVKLLTNDRYFALLMIRSLSYGEKYGFNMTCSSCNLHFKHEVEIPGEFPIKTLEDDAVEPFEIKLPVSGTVVGFRLLRGDDENAISRYADQQFAKNKVDGDPTYIYRLARHIASVDGETIDLTKDTVKALRFVEGLIGRDSAALRNAIEDADCGIDVTIQRSCPRCDEFIETPMPMTAEFFVLAREVYDNVNTQIAELVYFGRFDPDFVENCITFDRNWFHNWLVERKKEENEQAQKAAARARARR